MDYPNNVPRNWGCRVNDRVTWNNMHAIILQNEFIQIVILLDKGAEIVQFLYKPKDIDFIWQRPIALQSPSHPIPGGGNGASSFFSR